MPAINRVADLEPRKKDALTVEQVAFLELLASTRDDQVGIFAGYMCFLIFGRLRWSDGQYCKEEPHLDEGREFSYLEARLYHHKTAGRTKSSRRLLPVACPVPGGFQTPVGYRLVVPQRTTWTHCRCREAHNAGASPRWRLVDVAFRPIGGSHLVERSVG